MHTQSSAPVTRTLKQRSHIHHSGYEPQASTAALKVNVIKNEEIYTAQYSTLGSADQPVVENLQAERLDKLSDKVSGTSKTADRDNLVFQTLPAQLEASRLQGTTCTRWPEPQLPAGTST